MTEPIRLPARTIIALEGPDTLALLERLVTNNTHDWAGGEARYGALLTPQGKLVADYLALRTGSGVLIDVAAAGAEDLARRLKLFRLRAEVEITPRDDLAIALDPAGHGDPRSDDLPARTILPAGETAGDASADWRKVRLAAGIAEFGEDFTSAEVFPSDINMDQLGGVDLKKGCFVGQEVVSRMHRRGNVRRRTMAISGEGVAPGASVTAGGSTLGEITSAQDNRGLARIRIDRLAKARAQEIALEAGGVVAELQLPAWLEEEVAAQMPDG